MDPYDAMETTLHDIGRAIAFVLAVLLFSLVMGLLAYEFGTAVFVLAMEWIL